MRLPLAGLIQAVNRGVFNESRFVFDGLGCFGKNGGYLKNASRIDAAGYVDTFSIPAYSHRHKKVGKKYYLCANKDDVLPDAELEFPLVLMQLVPEVLNDCRGNYKVNSITLKVTASDFYGHIKFVGDWKHEPDIIEKQLRRVLEGRHLNKLSKKHGLQSRKSRQSSVNQ